jgi:hypothetical protein
MCDDIAKSTHIDFENFDKSGAKFIQKRKKFSSLQKLTVD